MTTLDNIVVGIGHLEDVEDFEDFKMTTKWLKREIKQLNAPKAIKVALEDDLANEGFRVLSRRSKG